MPGDTNRIGNNNLAVANGAPPVSNKPDGKLPAALQSLIGELENATFDTDRQKIIEDKILPYVSHYSGDKVALLQDIYYCIGSPRCRGDFLKLLAKHPEVISQTELAQFRSKIGTGRRSSSNTSPIIAPPQPPRIKMVQSERPVNFGYLIPVLGNDPKSTAFASIKTVGKGAKLFSKGETSDGKFYIVVKGEVTVTLPDGRTVTSGPGDAVGEIGWLINIPRTADVEVNSSSAELIEVDGRSPEFRRWLSETDTGRRFNADVKQLVAGRLINQSGDIYNQPFENIMYSAGTQTPDGQAQPREIKLELISNEKLMEIYERDGSSGVSKYLFGFFYDQALKGDPVGLEAWMRFMQGAASESDMETIFSYFEKGQTHLHPTRSLPPEFVLEMGRERLKDLSPSEWAAMNGRCPAGLTQRLFDVYSRDQLVKWGYVTEKGEIRLQNIFADYDPADPKSEKSQRALEVIKELIIYDPEPGEGTLVDYLDTGKFISSLFRTPRDVVNASYKISTQERSDGVTYMELRFSPLKEGMSIEDTIMSYIQGIQQAENESGGRFEGRVIIIYDTTMQPSTNRVAGDHVSRVPVNRESDWGAEELTDAVIDFCSLHPELAHYIVGADTAGPEAASRNINGLVATDHGSYFDITKFQKPFAKLFSKLDWMQLTVHGGENFIDPIQGLDNIARLLDMGAVRIGHGLVLGIDFKDPETRRKIMGKYHYTEAQCDECAEYQTRLLQRIARDGVVIEACPTSNTQTIDGVTYKRHPISRFQELGVNVTLSTDNSTTSGTSATRELSLIAANKKLSFMGLWLTNIGGLKYKMGTLGRRGDRYAPQNGESPVDAAVKWLTRMSTFDGSITSEIPEIVGGALGGRDTVVTLVMNGEIVSTNSARVDLLVGETGSESELISSVNRRAETKYWTKIYLVDQNGKQTGDFLLIATDNKGTIDLLNSRGAELGTATRTSIDLSQYFSNIRRANANSPLKPDLGESYAAFYSDIRARIGQNNARIDIILVNTALTNINKEGGHTNGDIYLSMVRGEIEKFLDAKGIKDYRIYKDGATYIVLLPESMPLGSQASIRKSLQEYLEERAGQGYELDVKGEAKTYHPQIKTLAVEYRANRDGKMDVKQFMASLDTWIVRLNKVLDRPVEEVKRLVSLEARPELDSLTAMRETILTSQSRQREEGLKKIVDFLEKNFNLSEKAARDVAERAFFIQYVDPQTGFIGPEPLYNEMVASARSGKPVTMLVLDMNNVGSYSAFDFGSEGRTILGTDMQQLVIYNRLYEACTEAFGEGNFVIARRSPGSDEFIISLQMPEEEARSRMGVFGRALNKPLPITVTEEEITRSKAFGEYKQYLESKRGTELTDRQVLDYMAEQKWIEKGKDGSYILYVNEVPRPKMVDGAIRFFRGITVTGVFRDVTDLLRGSGSPEELRAEVARAHRESEDQVDREKTANPDRETRIVKANGRQAEVQGQSAPNGPKPKKPSSPEPKKAESPTPVRAPVPAAAPHKPPTLSFTVTVTEGMTLSDIASVLPEGVTERDLVDENGQPVRLKADGKPVKIYISDEVADKVNMTPQQITNKVDTIVKPRVAARTAQTHEAQAPNPKSAAPGPQVPPRAKTEEANRPALTYRVNLLQSGKVEIIPDNDQAKKITLNRSYWDSLVKLGAGYGLTPDQVARAVYISATDQAGVEGNLKRGFTLKNLNAWLETPNGKAFLVKNKDTLGNRIFEGGPSLLAGIIGLLGAEEIAQIIGIDPKTDPVGNFAFILGVTHLFNVAANKPISTLTQFILYKGSGANAVAIVERDGQLVVDIKNLQGRKLLSEMFNYSLGGAGAIDLLKGTIKFPVKMLEGMGPGMFTSAVVTALASAFGMQPGTAMNALSFGSFFIPDIINIALPRVATRAGGRLAIGLMAGGQVLKKFLGAAGAPFALGMGLDLWTMLWQGGYERYVNQRAMEEDGANMINSGGWLGYVGAFLHSFASTYAPTAMASLNCTQGSRNDVMEGDRKLSLQYQQAVREFLKVYLLTMYKNVDDVDLSFLTQDIEFNGIEEDIYKMYTDNIDLYSQPGWTPERISEDMRKKGLTSVQVWAHREENTPEAVERTLLKIQQKQTQEAIKFLVFVALPCNDPIRALFDKDGHLLPVKGKEAQEQQKRDLIRFVFGIGGSRAGQDPMKMLINTRKLIQSRTGK